ncbi:MAG: prepilin-type N-terminal cleavage/methylation domain-containing protein, partial [Rubrobacteraceae bacterium]|nr:prepilin-type N-terminal cleavage/methylation domain-containing protein [Rubrobacteraceae bacterium]
MMGVLWQRPNGLWKDERGFTLPELMTTIAILGILIAIAIIIWLGILERRRVDAAANQLAADMRLAHT